MSSGTEFSLSFYLHLHLTLNNIAQGCNILSLLCILMIIEDIL